jgi:coenzyme F420-reducing hydrogenase gamma subunit
MAKPRLGVVKFASCDGCQLTLLDLEDELLAITDRVEVVEFPEATTARSPGPYDLLLVEGSVSTPEQAHEIVELRRQAGKLVTIGACATAGGIQALRNVADHDAWRAAIYPEPAWIESLATATPIAEHVTVDAELRGCPIAPGQLVEFLSAALVGRRPQLPDEAICLECKRAGRVCVVVASGEPCLGPVTRTGCGALCPAYARGCYACFGPRESANVTGLRRGYVASDGLTEAELDERFAGFTAMAPAFAATASAAAAAYREGTVAEPTRDRAQRPEDGHARH